MMRSISHQSFPLINYPPAILALIMKHGVAVLKSTKFKMLCLLQAPLAFLANGENHPSKLRTIIKTFLHQVLVLSVADLGIFST